MLRRQVLMTVLCGLLLSGLSGDRAEGKTSDSDRELVQRVAARLFAVAEPVEGWEWPPVVEINDEPVINAYATLTEIGEGTSKKTQPKIVVHQGYLDEVVQGKEDRLAELLGHELSHILLRHVGPREPGITPLVTRALGREAEVAADVLGVKLALKAGYAYAGVIGGMKRMREVTPKDAPFERLLATHPSTSERLAIIDEHNRELWQSMTAFENGCYFLMCEQYALAERCFKQVVREFPNCYEGWANLGYARLMMYCDALSPDDLRGFDLGQLVVGGFYRRPDSLETVRGVNEELWFEAVGALREALRLKPDLLLAKANLAVASLVRPAGKDVGRAAELFDEVTTALRSGAAADSIDPVTRAALLINAGVSEMASGRSVDGERFFAEAESLLKAPGAGSVETASASPLLQAVRYNRAVVQAASGETTQEQAAQEAFERYLTSSSTAGAWWTLAYERYAKLCQTLMLKPKSKEELAGRKSAAFRLVTHVTLPGGETVALTDAVDEATKRLGEGVALPVLARSALRRLHYGGPGIDLLVTDRQIIAICLCTPETQPIELKGSALGSETKSLRVGMSKQDLEALVGEDGYDFRELVAEGINYRFYRNLGVAVRIEKGIIRELVVVQIPQAEGLK